MSEPKDLLKPYAGSPVELTEEQTAAVVEEIRGIRAKRLGPDHPDRLDEQPPETERCERCRGTGRVSTMPHDVRSIVIGKRYPMGTCGLCRGTGWRPWTVLEARVAVLEKVVEELRKRETP